MKILFAHDHKFREIGEDFFSPGGLSNDILSRYTKWFDEIIVVGRVIKEEKIISTYSKIVNTKIKIVGRDKLFEEIRNCEGVIARLPSINGYLAVYLAKLLGKPCLVEVVGCTFDAYWYYSLLGKFLTFPAYCIMRHCVSLASHTLYVTKRFLQKRYPSRNVSISISDLSIKLEENDESILENRVNKIKSNSEKIVIGTTAAVDVPYKGQAYVIQAISDIEENLGKSVEYQLVGAGKIDKLSELCCNVGVADKVKFIGLLPHDDVFRWLDSLDIYIHPSKLEGLSRAIMEAMSRGLPCIAADCGGNPELLSSECLYNMNHEKSISSNIANAVQHLYRDHNMIKEAVRNYSLIQTEYNPDLLISRRDSFYLGFKQYILEKSDRK